MDGDGDLDVVTVTATRVRILRNTDGSFQRVATATIQLGKAVAAGDVDGDDRPDVYVMAGETSSGENAPDRVFLKDETGTTLTSFGPIPSATTGRVESVWPIDHRRETASPTSWRSTAGRTRAVPSS
jgi:FG-GAP-like repeat